jgi:DNA-binding transcriptional LysR family regulator
MADADTTRSPRGAAGRGRGAGAAPPSLPGLPVFPGLPGLDLNLLKAFSAVYHFRQVTAAAQHLDMTPSAVSNALARLRLHCGDTLFVRTQRGVVPTPFADRLWQSVAVGLDLLQKALAPDAAFTPARSERMFRVNLADVGQMLMVGEVMRGIAAEAPGVGIRTVDLNVLDVERSLVSGALDLAVGHLAHMGKRLFRRKLVSEQFVCVVGPQHTLYRRPMALEDFLAGTHIRYSPAAVSLSSLNEAIERFFKQQHRVQRIALHAAHAFGLSAIVAETSHILTVPARLAAHYARLAPLRIHPLPVKVPAFDISLYWHERDHRDPAHQWFRGKFADAVKGAEAP